MRSSKAKRYCRFESLEARQLLAADIVLNEFMAANKSTLHDGFGASSDWVELRNAGDELADLSGFHLTDDEDNLSKWTFPDGTTIAAGEFLVIFASSFDRIDDDGRLHTNFGLSAGGDYIALTNTSLEIVSDLTGGRNYPSQFADISYGISQANGSMGQVGFLTTPTPGAPNISPIENVGPELRNVTRDVLPISSGDALPVTARVNERYAGIDFVSLTYRSMFGEETTIAMRDDGQGGDAVATDGIYSATIPADVSQNGDMLRWYVTAVDTAANTSRAPAFLDDSGTDQSPEYFGTIVSDTPIDTQLPVLEWFMPADRQRAADSGRTVRASVYFEGEFYDNVGVRRRGGSSTSLPKKSYKFDFNTGNDFRFDADAGRVTEINVNTTYTNKDYIRQALAFEVYDQAGVPGSEAFPIRLQQNGEFFSVAMFVEQPDEDFLSREGLDPNGALYKMFNTFTTASNTEKKSRQYDSNDDLASVTREINRLAGIELRNYIFDNINVPEVLSYLAATVITQNNDQSTKNYFVYRDSDGSGEWSVFPWDLDLSFGLHFMSNDSILDDTIYADKDNFTTFAGVTIWPSHPFVGDSEHPQNRNWNRLIDAMYQVPEIREMHLRRLRSLMDEMLQAPETPQDQLKLEARLDEYADLIRSDVELDYAKWANPWPWGSDLSLDEAMQRMKDEYFTVRRQHLYVTHLVDNLNPEQPTVIIPEFAQARYFVPADDSLGTEWTRLGFADDTWDTGPTGIGYENSPRNFEDLIKTRVKPSETVADGTSIFVRIPFTVDDLSTFEALTLRMKYDDGFVAYLNGTEVARASLREDGPQSYNSRGRARSNSLSAEFESFSLSQHLDVLRTGENVLAIHGLNSSATNSDMLILPELLEGTIVTGDIAGIPHAQPEDVTISFGDAIEFNPASGNQDEEYLTLVNTNDFAVDISDWSVQGSVKTFFAKGTVMAAGGTLYVSPNVRAFRNRSHGPTGGQGLFVQSYDGHLSNSGDTLRLLDASGRQVSETSYEGDPQSAQHDLRITEINYNPYPAMLQFNELDTDNDSFEFVEVLNTGQSPVELSGVRFLEIATDGGDEGIDFTFDPGMLLPGERTIVVKNVAAFESRYGSNLSIAGTFAGKLSNGGETLTLVDANDDVIQKIRYNDSADWPQEADGEGATLNIVDVNGDFDAPSNWQASYEFAGSPGSATVPRRPTVVVNELLTRTAGPSVDQVELYNLSDETIDISGWYVSDSSNYFKHLLPAGTTLESSTYLVLSEADLGFGFKGETDDDIWLVQPDGFGRPQFFADHVIFGETEPEQSIGRVPDGTGEFVPLANSSFGAANEAAGSTGDFNGDGVFNVEDIDLLCQEIRAGDHDVTLDLTNDQRVDVRDLDALLEQMNLSYGDVNLDGIFNSSDLVLIFQSGQYEDEVAGNSRWSTGDWNCDGDFTTTDLVVAFQQGTYVAAAIADRLLVG